MPPRDPAAADTLLALGTGLVIASRRAPLGLRSPPALDDSTDLIKDCGSMQSDGLRHFPPTCPDSSPELIPAAVGSCSTFCLEAEASVTASKEPVLPHVPVLSNWFGAARSRATAAAGRPVAELQCARPLFTSSAPGRRFPANAFRCSLRLPWGMATVPCTLFGLPHSVSPAKAWARCRGAGGESHTSSL